tara:strand:- start:332 stop:1423 length:1092 start_codon:yes stop_codon:yes gene_type:complete
MVTEEEKKKAQRRVEQQRAEGGEVSVKDFNVARDFTPRAGGAEVREVDVRSREKQRGNLIRQGLSPKQQEAELNRLSRSGGGLGQTGIARTGAGLVSGTLEQTGTGVAQPTEALAEAGGFEQVTPREVDLSSELGTDIPIVTPTLAAFSQAAAPISGLALAQELGYFPNLIPKKITGEEAFSVPLTPETLREVALREISIQSFDEGISRAERFGTFVEGIPLVGNRARAWAGGLIEQPSDNAQTVLNEINDIKEAASTGQEKVRKGLEDPEYGLSRARDMEEDIAKLKGRLKLLIETSPVLKANADQVNGMQEDVLEAEEKVSRYRKAASFGFSASLTGTRVIATDEQIFLELKRLNELKGGN